MVMDNKHMVDGDGVGDDDGEEAHGGGALGLVRFRPSRNRVFSHI
jgi:hypothetical protein